MEDTLENSRLYSEILDGGWEYIIRGRNIEEYLDNLRVISNSKFASESDRKFAASELTEVTQYLDEKARKAKQKAEKSKLCRKRRSDFDKVRDSSALALINRDGFQCQVCKSQDDITIDHVVPLSKGGTDDISNLRFLCRTCNSRKNDKETR